MTAKEYLESKGLNDHDYMDSGMINHISEMMEEYHQAKKLLIQRVSNRFYDHKFIDNVCVSYRHDFGLLDKQEQDKLRFECKEWMRAIKNNEPY
jgi:hypothetical protein